MTPDQLLKLATYFEKQAQQMSAQPAHIQGALEQANLWNLSKNVSPLLNAAKVPEEASVAISIQVNPGGKVSYQTNLNPENVQASNNLNQLLQKTFSAPMSRAIQGAKLNVENPVSVNWLTF